MKQPISQAKLEANRRNAQLSTGPRTPEGKTAVSVNSLIHGVRARGIPVRVEDVTEFKQLCADYFEEWQPQTHTEVDLLEQMAVTKWKLGRMEVIEANANLQSTLYCLTFHDRKEFVTEKGTLKMPDVSSQREAMINRNLDRISKHIVRLERSWFRALETLQRLQDRRIKKERQFQKPVPAESEAPKVQAAGGGGEGARPIFAGRKRFGGSPIHQPSGLPDGV